MEQQKRHIQIIGMFMLLALVYASICSAAFVGFQSVRVTGDLSLDHASLNHMMMGHNHQDQDQPSAMEADCCTAFVTAGKGPFDTSIKIVFTLVALIFFICLRRSLHPVHLVLQAVELIPSPPSSLVAQKVCLTC